ncbi:MAG: hypothetical protein GY940_31525, partial [bacterium]|nr:hypothetical protein [bacterium]
MRKYLILVIVTVNIFLISCAPLREQGNIVTEYPPPPDGHPAIVILAEYRDTNKPDNRVVPYFVSLMALDLLKRSPSDYLGYIKPYLNWYLDHLNYPDKYGLTGSIYDYRIYDDGREEPLEDMDSVDSYAALFIMLVNRYFDLTGDWQFIESNRQKLEDIAYLMPYLQRDDGLTVALPETTVKYLMDNCEVLEGVSAFVALTSKRGWDIQSYYREVQSDLIQAIGNLFYNPQLQNY